MSEASREEQVNKVIADYLRAVEAGHAPARQELLARHPELAAELRRRMVPILETRPAKEWELAINQVGVPVSVCQTVAEWLVDEQALATRSVISLEDPELGATRQAGFPIALSRTPPEAT